ncbi:MAG TPA: adenylate/guanylate cyclase domain-containing protein [Thermoanaerobaculia bacterium]|nr:adenylate/guanylate cyclase domain-containing protein [Thermoanaerobaculia bacterium]
MGPESESLRPEDLIRYVPAHVSSRIARGLPAVAFSEVMPAAALFADISGFTSLSERLAARGGDGVEELTRILNAYFGRLIAVVTGHGGDVVKFAGDALLAFWPVEDDQAALDRAAHIAARCALQIQEAVTQFDAPPGERLSLRVGVGAGTAVAASLGGIYGRYEFVLSGPAVVEATNSAAHAEPGFCIVGAEAWKRVAPLAEATDAGQGTMQLVRVRGLELPPPAPPPMLDASAVPSLLAYIPASIHRRLGARQSGWLAELRRLTVLFVKMPGLGYGTPFETALSVMRAVQTELYRYEGSVNKLSVDEKGVTMLAALGLPPLSHEDDARRGTLAAMDMKARLEELGQKTSVGVNSGNAFCGTIGDATRCEYTLIGDVVNVSARLMQAASGGLLCGETTRKMASESIDWEPLEPITVKGKAKPLPVFRPVGRAQPKVVRASTVAGRGFERARIEARLLGLYEGKGSVILIEGDAGIGKSTLVEWIKLEAGERDVVVLEGAADPAQSSTSYFAWRPVFRRLFGLDDTAPVEAQRAQVLGALDEVSRQLLPLLEPVLALGFTDNETTASMFGEVRSDNTVALLARLLRENAAKRPHLIAIEDAHWFDSASWTLAARVADEVPASLFVLTTRPLPDPVPRAWSDLHASPAAEPVALGPLGPGETLELVRRRLGVESLPGPVADFLRDRAQGNPFFVQEMAAALLESGRIIVDGGRCELAPGFTLAALPFPDTVQGVVTSRIDRLPAAEQLTLKVASVVGRTFTAPLLEDVYPIQEDRSAQAGHLEALASQRLVQREDVSYAFSNAVTQDVAYELMAPTQRRELHGSVARWYETNFASELAVYYPLLARHWSAADRPVNAIDYLEKSGQAALRDHANEEALEFFEQALSMATLETVDDDRRASWLRQCAEAHYNLGRLSKSREVFREALELLGAPLPATTPGMLFATVRQMSRQTVHRFFASRFVGRARAAPERALEAARAYERLAQIHYLNNEKIETIHAAFRSINLAEVAGPSPELARSYGNMAVVSGLLMMHGTARAHAGRALATAQAVNHPPTTAYVHFVRGVYYVTVASWDEGEADLRASIDIALRIGDRRRWYETAMTLANLLSRRGNVTESRTISKEMLEAGTRRSVPQVQVWGASWGLWCRMLLEKAPHATEEEATLTALCLDPTTDVPLADRIGGASMLALGRFRRGDRVGALAAADAAEAVIKTTDQVSHYLLESYLALAEVYDGLWADRGAAMRRRMVGMARLANRYAMMYPIGKPVAILIRGWIASRDGNTAAAAKLYRRAIIAAARCRMPATEAAAHRALATRAGLDDAECRHHTALADALDAG